jgi:hypothetical protein
MHEGQPMQPAGAQPSTTQPKRPIYKNLFPTDNPNGLIPFPLPRLAHLRLQALAAMAPPTSLPPPHPPLRVPIRALQLPPPHPPLRCVRLDLVLLQHTGSYLVLLHRTGLDVVLLQCVATPFFFIALALDGYRPNG